MKIIRNGTLYPKQVTCEDCNSIIEYNEEDEVTLSFGFLSNPLNTLAEKNLKDKPKYIKCPVCGGYIIATCGYKNMLF